MAETSTLNSDNKVEHNEKEEADGIKKEVEVSVKREQLECVVCAARCRDCRHIYGTNTAASGSPLHHFLNKYTSVDLASAHNCSKYICKSCLDLINVLEQAEIDYLKLKETFEAIISKNPLFEAPLAQPIRLSTIKVELDCNEDFPDDLHDDSDDEPLATRRKQKQHKVQKKKKKVLSSGTKRNVRTKSSNVGWKCDECGKQGTSGGTVSLAAHKLVAHTLTEDNSILRDIKTEDSAEGSENVFNNGFETCLKLEAGDFDDDSLPDNDEDFTSSSVKTSRKKGLVGRPKSKSIPGEPRKRKVKVVHQCDQCDAKYTSLPRLEQHKQKHDGSKPPYICEVCGAHYKHKRACDIHIALHKGISDWKCEECNKLFPSKNALQRHNNIHTGKLNYQCDLCGKSFIHTSSFKMHKLSHSGVKPHACDVCGLALMTRSHLKRHKRVHSGEKRHECNVCGKRFSERYNLAAHSKSHEASEQSPAPQPPRRRLFRCSFCPERYERRYMLERHTSAAHGRTLERPPPTPRNTMSKLLKAQAQRRDPPPPHAPPLATLAHSAPPPDADTKDDRSSDSHTTPITPQKLIAQLSSSTSILASGAWAGSYAAEFGLRHDFPH